jgi:hypothetical protein
VRGNDTARYLVGTPDTTYAAYNDWGGASLYGVGNNVRSDERISAPRAVKVSFDRPYHQGAGASQVLPLEANAIHWLERQGYDLSYISNVDLHKNPRQVFQHRAYLSLGLDEYWTIDMRYGLQRARDFGVGLAFLGADAGYWQMRFEPDQAGMPYRTVVCYKVSTASKDLALDPEYGQDNTRVTTRWRDPLLALPENSLIGVMYSNLTKRQAYISWQVAPSASRSQLLAGTGLQPGRTYGCDLVGPRWDRVFPGSGTPSGLQVLGTSHPRDDYNVRDTSNTTYYIAPSGALVFASGSTSWSNTLDAYRFRPDMACGPQQDVVSALQVLMARIMDALVLHHPLQRLSM